MFLVKGQYGWVTPAKNKQIITIDGKEFTLWVDVQFCKCQEPLKEKIYIKTDDWWLTFYQTKKGELKVKIMVNSWVEDIKENNGGENQNTQQKQSDPFANKTIHQNQAPKTYQPTLNGDNTSVTGGIEDTNQDYIDIKSNDLPFY